MKHNKFGFTLVELLIVIALLGALAVGLLAALDPFEQLKKGTDTGIRNTTQEIQGSVIRYYAIKNHMPWCDETQQVCPNLATTSLADTTVLDMVSNLTSAGELKSNFMELADAYKNKIFVTGDATDANPSVIVCFLPQAKSFKADPNTKYEWDGAEHTNYSTTCSGHGTGTDVCFWCIK